MRPNNLLVKGTAAMMLTFMAASCSNDEPATLPSGDGNVTFSVGLADAPQTRAFADGKSAVNLKCAVYDAKGKLVTEKDATFTDLKASVQLQLVKGEKYDVVFFASRSGEVYGINTTTGKVTVNYANMNNGTDDAGVRIDDDCFYKMVKDYTAGSSVEENVTLTRPVAQVNFGTDDIEAAIVATTYPAGVYTQMSVDAYPTLNLLTGEAEGDPVNVVMPLTAVDEALKGETFPLTGENAGKYKYMSMGYVLVPEAGSVSNITMGAFNGESAVLSSHAVVIPNAPMKRNHRTNIFGSLLTSSSDWTVRVDEGWDGKFDITDYAGDEALVNGGTVRVADPVDAIVIPSDLDQPLTLNVNAAIGKLTIGATTQPVTINVARDVDYPEIVFTRASEVKGLTIKGDPASTKAISGFAFNTFPTLSRPAMLEDLTLEGLLFEEHGFEPQYSTSIRNVVIRNCRFSNMKDAAIATQQTGAGTNFLCDGLLMEGCEISFADDAKSNANGLYLKDFNGEVIVRNNTITNAPYHGIYLAGRTEGTATKAVVTGNTIVNALKDGIKVENTTGAINVDNNTITARENGIRLKNSILTADVSVCGNNIDMKDVTAAWNEADGEPSGILLFNKEANAGAKLTVKDNTVTNCTTQPFTKRNITEAAGSDTANPVK